MKKSFCIVTGIALSFFSLTKVHAQTDLKINEPFKSLKYEKIGRGECTAHDSILMTKDAYAAFGENSWTDYEIKFRARVPQAAKEMQICAGFRAANRDDRYFLLLKGGIQKDLYLARLGYLGTDDFLALRQLDFQPMPGKWYDFKIQVTGSRIRIFLNNEALPRIDITDKYTKYAASGKITLGGSWIENDFTDFSVKALGADALRAVPVGEYALPLVDKENLRTQQRATYKPIIINHLDPVRTEVSLNGKWLFAPGYEVSDEDKATLPTSDDESWHVMTVPNFWNPIRVWLHGERYNTDSKGVSDNYYQKETGRCEAYTFDYKKTNIGWYRQWIELPESIHGKNLELSFDAVSKVAEVWINGKKAGSHIGMFGDFTIDATPLLKPGKNLVAVEVQRDYVKDIKDPNKLAGIAVTVEVTEKMVKDLAHGFFNNDPAGIWQPVKLVISDPLRIEDVFIEPSLTGASFDVTVKNYGANARKFAISTGIAADR
jgi:beta-galactosidase